MSTMSDGLLRAYGQWVQRNVSSKAFPHRGLRSMGKVCSGRGRGSECQCHLLFAVQNFGVSFRVSWHLDSVLFRATLCDLFHI
jgi:hypothetical protein